MSKIIVELLSRHEPYSLYNYNSQETPYFGELNVRAIEEFNPYIYNDKIDLNLPTKMVNDAIYYDINYIYKNILMRVGNINKNYLFRISDELNGCILEEKVYIRYNEYTEKKYEKTNVYVTQNIVEYILANYNSYTNILRRDFESYIAYMYGKTYRNEEDLSEANELELNKRAKKYVEHIYLVKELNRIIGKNINTFDMQRMSVGGIEKEFEKPPQKSYNCN